ncbi:MAG: penicillin-binding protein 2 [Bacteroidetes bacterium]|nr:penicillin-binding protein 2 [Bacteroidota bacterium]
MKNIYSERKYVVIGIFLAVGFIFIAKLFYLQIINKSYLLSAQNNVIRIITQYPARGLIFDRNGKLLVYNEAAYDLMVVPDQVKKFDTLELCNLIGIDREIFTHRLKSIREYSTRKASVFEKQISKETYGYMQEKLFKFPGFYVQSRILRSYTYPIAAHTFGYIGEVDNATVSSDPYYKPGDYIGISGIEKTYEKELRGVNGVKRIMVDVFNREKGSFQNGKYDTSAVKGKDLWITIDADLQLYAEQLMAHKKGSIVAIEPSSGEILCLVSCPSYDPNLLVGRVRSKNYEILEKDTLQPLFNRALQATYPPGSSFKLMNALIALQEGTTTPEVRFPCNGTASVPIKCSHYHPAPQNMLGAIELSCNPFFWRTFNTIMNKTRDIHDSYNLWRNHVMSFGFGNSFSSDLFTEVKGFIPATDYYDKYFGEKGWRSMTIRSLSIGQGEILVTPLQLANYVATISNRGYYYVPHLMKSIESEEDYSRTRVKKTTTIDPKYFTIIVEGMYNVFEGSMGTARHYKVDSLDICGKTGTAENPHGKAHSIFIAFAPKDNPRIAMAVIVENAGFGATWAAPITTLLIEKYLTGKTKRKDVEERIINCNLIGD